MWQIFNYFCSIASLVYEAFYRLFCFRFFRIAREKFRVNVIGLDSFEIFRSL